MVAMASSEGLTATIVPLTPDLAGSPTRTNQLPAPSYMPQVLITARTVVTTAVGTTCSPVSGLRPPVARVAPITARSAVVTVIAQERR